jgi:hypothetical protein
MAVIYKHNKVLENNTYVSEVTSTKITLIKSELVSGISIKVKSKIDFYKRYTIDEQKHLEILLFV